jgi:membrane dipeptidase
MPLYVDGHLDLAANAVLKGRDLTQPVDVLRQSEKRTREEVLVTLPELQRAEVGVAFATLFALTAEAVRPPAADPLTARERAHAYRTPEEAERAGLEQLAVYERWEEAGHVRVLRTRGDLDGHAEKWEAGDRTLGLVLLMEGADPIRQPDDVGAWFDRGVRIVGPAWQRTRYAGGTHAPGPLTPAGRDLAWALDEAGLALDLSHLAEESFWDALDAFGGPVLASHSNARAITPTDRHLSDAMLRAVGERDGVVGLVLGNAFLRDGVARDAPKEAVTLADVAAQAEHVAAIVGWGRVAVGSDFDGGFGLQEVPAEITRGADFGRLGEAVPAEARDGFLGGNWLRFLRRALPA